MNQITLLMILRVRNLRRARPDIVLQVASTGVTGGSITKVASSHHHSRDWHLDEPRGVNNKIYRR